MALKVPLALHPKAPGLQHRAGLLTRFGAVRLPGLRPVAEDALPGVNETYSYGDSS